MKQLLVFMFLALAAGAQAQTFQWGITPGLQTTLDIYSARINVSAYSDFTQAYHITDVY